METVVRVEGNGDGKFEETGVEKTTTITSPKQIADPVVYKLVRVEGDGRLVPATDQEVLEVFDLLENDKSTMHIDADSGKSVGCISNEGSSSGKSQLESLEGLSQPENTEAEAGRLNARIEYIEDMLQKVKQEERLHLAFGSPDHSSAYMHVNSQCSDHHDRLHVIDEKPQSIITLQETLPPLSPNINDSRIHRYGSLGDCCSNPPREPVECESSPSSDCPSQKPDFSKLKGEICLDNQTIRELQETFKAAFGRETTVKDKMWLKRRIAMGLTNSCYVSTSTFIIKDNKLVVKGEKESCNNMDHGCIMNGTQDDCHKVSPTDRSGQIEDHETVSAKRLRNYNVKSACEGEDFQNEQTTRKRVRKPTRRYIEELSESDSVDHGERLLATSRCSPLEQISPRSFVRPVRNVSSDQRAVITRLDSLGGSGVQIPYVSRIRRSRPRKNVMALMFHPTGLGMAAEVVKKAVGVQSSESSIENEKRVIKAGYATEPITQQVFTEPENKQQSVPSKIETGQNVELKHSDYSGETSDDNIATVPTPKGGMRRKHHRAWTLSEVMKLVDGVSRYGAGRWSEIKRLAFASYSYRTSVDLKDKWRNLLKASSAQTPPDKEINSRKHVSMAIPAPVLSRVRELAEMHAQGVQSLGPNKIGGTSGRSVHDTRSGFL